ncbi:MAG: hypothetical protein EZS28_005201 [Streblomastix strix]|uniref:Uncharacterized protein n=1 Tax=Streblomastix strix TaxID=222440 RepID=A0A5J4WW89_9EUKA|nr:MAG: hypothetical protein EZS28_005201 [Streblomastix strix]
MFCSAFIHDEQICRGERGRVQSLFIALFNSPYMQENLTDVGTNLCQSAEENIALGGNNKRRFYILWFVTQNQAATLWFRAKPSIWKNLLLL